MNDLLDEADALIVDDAEDLLANLDQVHAAALAG